ncbi:transposase family protein [Paraburkholderia sp. BL25I1N1]|uniref:transposase family protein n=1 Tax=Paraburkholderia sp. BL25I1N1 TaxID=1938804 RepID=UPI0011B1DCB5|nr:transposase family protein [Paraburkholderia sp. BL25I1N1]
MLGPLELARYFDTLRIPDPARELIDSVRAGKPCAQALVHPGIRSIVSLNSAKMHRDVWVASRTLRGSAAMWYEFDRTVLEYYAYPHVFDLEAKREDGRIIGRTQQWMDFLVLWEDRVAFNDWREESSLLRAEEKDAGRWEKIGRVVRDEADRWHDRECEAYCSQFGIEHQVRTSRELPRIFLENSRYLRDYFDAKTPILASDTVERLKRCVHDGPASLDEMMKRHGFEADVLLIAIAQGQLHADLFRDRIGDPASFMIYRDATSFELFRALQRAPWMHEPLPLPGLADCSPGTTLQYGGKEWAVVLATAGPKAEALLTTEDGCTLSLPVEKVKELRAQRADPETLAALLNVAARRNVANLTPKALADGVTKYLALHGEGAEAFGRSSLARWRGKVRHASSGMAAILTLARQDASKGNRQGRLASAVECLAETIIKTKYNTPEAPNKARAYELYKTACEDSQLKPMSYVTFCKRVDLFVNVPDRHGVRIAYRDGEIPLVLDARESVSGVLPHEVCYIDHTLFMLFTSGPNGQPWGKVWLSVGVDGNVTNARALYMSYRAPSAASVLMVLRDYVRRWRRLPRVLVIDGGSDLRSESVKAFCKMFNIDFRWRSGPRPRGGATVETVFALTEEEMLSGLEGNSMQLKEARMITAAVDPQRRHKWTFAELYQKLDQFLFDVRYRHHVHPAFGMTQAEFEAQRIEQTGRRDHIYVDFDENLLLLTAPPPPHAAHTIHSQRGVWESGMWYWHADFAKFSGQKCPVRCELWCANVIYVYVDGQWKTAIARDTAPFWGRTRYEVEQQKRHARNFNRLAAQQGLHSMERARYMTQVRTPIQFDPVTAEKQNVEFNVYNELGMTYCRPFDLGNLLPMPSGPESDDDHTAVATEAVPDAAVAVGSDTGTVNVDGPSRDQRLSWGSADDSGML